MKNTERSALYRRRLSDDHAGAHRCRGAPGGRQGHCVYIDRHGLNGLATALEYAFEYVDGTVNHRIAARELDLSPLEAEIILQALEPIAEAHTAE